MARESRQEKARKETRLTPEEDPEFQIAPMVDILLVLLVFFMTISSTEVMQKTQEIILPVSKDAKDASDVDSGQAIVNVTWVGVSDLGGIAMGEKKFAEPEEIIPDLQSQILNNPQLRVLIRADKNVRYEYLREVLRAIGDAGVANVTFSVLDKEVPQG